MLQGILLINKPRNWTSFDVVNYVRKIVATTEDKKPKHVKCGHTGTLDPLATGLLVLLLGKEYTRQAEVLSKHDKSYEVVMRLGYTSTTGDEEGEKSEVSNAVPSTAAIEEACQSLVGTIFQTPPIYSAIKVNGKRAYDLARKGQTVKMQPRKVSIHEITDITYDYPVVKFTARVGSGTYIRSLVEDIGSLLHTGAYMSGLTRTSVGSYSLQNALEISDLNPETIAQAVRP